MAHSPPMLPHPVANLSGARREGALTGPIPMRPVLARTVALGALACGLAGDLLVEGGGIGLAAYLVAVVSALRVALRTTLDQEGFAWPPPGNRRALGQSSLLLGLATLFALLLMGRESEPLVAFNTLVALGAIVLAAAFVPGSGLNLVLLRVHDLLRVALIALNDLVTGALRFLIGDSHALFGDRTRGTNRVVVAGVVRALLLGGTVTLLLGVLLAQGDPVFERSTAWVTRWNLPKLFEHAFLTLFFGVPVLGLARGAVTRFTAARGSMSLATDVVGDDAAPGAAAQGGGFILAAAERVSLNRLDALVVLGAANALFAAFVLLQLRVLFGGQAYVAATTGLTLAEYARSGFFALVLTSAVTIGILLLLDATLDATPDDERSRPDAAVPAIDAALRPHPLRRGLATWNVSRRLSLSLLTLTGAILLSATTRMMLYVSAFGFTVDRVVALAIIGWLAVVAALFAITVLQGRARVFIASAAATGAFTLLVLNAVNVEAIVVRTGFARAAARAPDAEYFMRDLGADAVPALVGALGTSSASIAPEIRCVVASRLLDRWAPGAPTDPRLWSVSRWRASRAVSRQAPALRAMRCRPAPVPGPGMAPLR